MYIFISILIVILALLLVLIVIVQNSKGGGLAAGFSSSNQVMGVRKTTDFLEKATWGLAGSIVVLCILASIFLPRNQNVRESGMKEELQNRLPAADQNAVSPFETPVSEGEQAPIAFPE
ncbi:MAG: preprotein translocase subunit SecG [Candidatus Symbiothrix sp.]|jgi:preprotein translocase subunit SecG|nr:preprotein translocase subunit SecG [Candidatus Symbiothrix sp.]